MSSSNLLEPLVSIIETVKHRIAEYDASLRENEIRTRVALIDPLLQALGWDVSDPSAVTIEFDVEGRRADYALLRSADRPAATIEAKRLGEALGTHRMQMLNYANASSVDFAGLTDGNHWELYEVFKRGELSERELLSVTIAASPSHESALKLRRPWRPNLASGAPIEAERPIVGLPVDSPRHNTSIATDVEPPPPTQLSERWIPLSEFRPIVGATPPMRISFPDGSTQEVKSFRQIMGRTAEWLYSSGSLTAKNVPLHTKRGRAILINSEPVSFNGNPMPNPWQVASQPIYMDPHGNVPTVMQKTRQILEDLGIDPATVYVLPAE